MDNIFGSFTNLYSLSKTLRFELKPVGETEKMLEDARVFEKDELIQEKYKTTKPYFDRLHREFVEESLNGTVLSGLTEYFEVLKNWQKDKKNKESQKIYKDAIKGLRKEVVARFDAKAKEWASGKYSELELKNKDIEILFEEGVFELLRAQYGEEQESILEVEEKNKKGEIVLDEDGKPKLKEVSIFESWKGFTGYFTKFFATRRNFYKNDGTSTALATRIIDQNLKQFCDNLILFDSIKEKVNFEEVEKTLDVSCSEVFSLDFYNQCLLQDGINSYNAILGGETLANGEKRKGLNECINKYRQDHKGEKLPFFKKLDKQILSEKEMFLDGIQDEAELLEVLKEFAKTVEGKTQFLKKLFAEFVTKNEEYELSQVYLSKEAFNTIVHKWTGETETFEEGLYKAMKTEKLAKYEKKDNSYKFPDFIALSYIKMALQSQSFEGYFWKDKYYEITGFEKKNRWEQFLVIFTFEFESLFSRTVKDESGDEKQIGYDVFSQTLEAFLKKEPFVLSREAKVIIKEFADSSLNIYQMAKYFAVEKKRAWLAEYELDSFYTHPETGYLRFYEDAYGDVVQVYNNLRNYLTKKPYSEEKWKLNFENPKLANGWDKSKESANFAVILRKEGKYYLGLMKKGCNQIFDGRHIQKFSKDIENGKYEKMEYKQIADSSKDIHNLVLMNDGHVQRFTKTENKEKYWPENIILIKQKKSYAEENFDRRDFEIFVNYMKKCAVGYWPDFNFNFSPTENYKNIQNFTDEISNAGYKISFQEISEKYINEKNKNGELYLFEIHNKDWNLDKARDGQSKTTQKNLHTLYFESLFSAENIAQNFPIKLNGQAEIFYRPKTEVEKLGMKKDKQGKEVINHKRYNKNKIFFHVPLTLNRTKSDPYQFNARINNFLAKNPSINIIGVDRGEKHLAYYSVVTQKGEILESGSLNTVNGINYAEKLETKAKNREQARKDWQAVEAIKDLKKGYISQVVRKLADLAIEHNAIIVFEDLNMRFKQIRGGIEKSVYQQLEKALIEKLNFLVKKGETDSTKAGYLLKAYQLTAPFEAFKDMGKQTGILFYTQAAYTSRIDPITGWRPHLYLKYSSAEKAKADILKFSKIEFVKGRFEFTYDIKNFQEAKEYPLNTVWTVCSSVERFRWDKGLNQNKGGYTHFTNLTDGKAENKNLKSTKPDNLKELFEKYGIDIKKDIKEQIRSVSPKGNEKLFEHFISFLNLICQIRNTDEKALEDDKKDFIFSPKEPFFDSRKSKVFGENLPQNGDDNGAYNIARKGIIILNKISQFSNANGNCEKMSWSDLYVTKIDWDNFVTTPPHA